jgi:DNA-damage-inducible protein D
MSEIEKYNADTFESIKNTGKNGREFWFARDLQKVLDYTDWRNFEIVISKAKTACLESDVDIQNHFVEVNKMVKIGSDAEREIRDIVLSRYACYLIVQNADPSKKIVALGQTYFAIMTRTQEVTLQSLEVLEEKKRLTIRHELIEHNKSLAEAAAMSGVITGLDYAIFQNKGYEGLYGGLGAQDIKDRKGLSKSKNILDYMGSTELAANLFRATQTDEKLRRDYIDSKEKANRIHYEVGSKVRQAIKDIGGTMPENLPTPPQSIQQIERKHRQLPGSKKDN